VRFRKSGRRGRTTSSGTFTIAKREFQSYINSPIPYILVTAYIATAGYMFFRQLFLVRQAIEGWIAAAESEPVLTLSWIRDVPALGEGARQLQRESQDVFIELVQALTGTPELHAAGIRPPSRQLAIMLLGGLHELIATTVEDGGRISDITELAVQATTVLLSPAR